MKKLLLTLILVQCGLAGICQPDDKRWKLNLGAQFAIPVFNMEVNTVGAGTDLKLLYSISPKFDLSADAGFTIFFAEKRFVPTGLVPVKLGASYWLNEKIFLMGKLGLGIYMLYTPGETVTKNFVGIEAGPGFVLSKRFDLGLTYNGYQNSKGSFGFMSAQLGYFLIK